MTTSTTLMAVRLQKEIYERLDLLAKKTGRSKSFYAKQAILRFLEDMEDSYLALDRLENPAPRYSMEEAKRMMGLED